MGILTWFKSLGGIDYAREARFGTGMTDGQRHDALSTIRQGIADERQRLAEAAERRRQEAAKAAAMQSSSTSDTIIRFSVSSPYKAFNSICADIASERSFARQLSGYVASKYKGKASICYERAGISRQVYSKIFTPRQDCVYGKISFKDTVERNLK